MKQQLALDTVYFSNLISANIIISCRLFSYFILSLYQTSLMINSRINDLSNQVMPKGISTPYLFRQSGDINTNILKNTKESYYGNAMIVTVTKVPKRILT